RRSSKLGALFFPPIAVLSYRRPFTLADYSTRFGTHRIDAACLHSARGKEFDMRNMQEVDMFIQRDRYIARWTAFGLIVPCSACNRLCVRSHRNGWLEHLMSWLGWYPWECYFCQTRFFARRKGDNLFL